MEIISEYDVSRGIENKQLVEIAHHTHYAWCEELERQKPGWGARYLPWELVKGSRHYERDLRFRIAAILGVLKELDVPIAELNPKFQDPMILPCEIDLGLRDHMLFKLMSISDSCWNEESDRYYEEVRSHERFKSKFRREAKRLYVASQLSVLKAIPNMNTKPTKAEIEKMNGIEYKQTMERFGNYCSLCGKVGQPVVQSLEGKGFYYCEDTKTCQ